MQNHKKNFQNHLLRPAGSHFWLAPNLQCELWSIVWMNINRVTLQRNKEFIMFIFLLFNGCITMHNLKKPLIRAAFWVLLQAIMFMNDWKHRLKLQDRPLTINKRNIIRWNIYRDNKVSFTKTSKVSLKILSL